MMWDTCTIASSRSCVMGDTLILPAAVALQSAKRAWRTLEK